MGKGQPHVPPRMSDFDFGKGCQTLTKMVNDVGRKKAPRKTVKPLLGFLLEGFHPYSGPKTVSR